MRSFDTAVEATNTLYKEGYTHQLEAKDNHIHVIGTDKKFTPSELVIHESFRFEGMTNPADSSEVLAVEAVDGTRGILVIAYGAKHSQNAEVIRDIPFASDKR